MIYFVAYFPPDGIFGGVRTLYRHADWLAEAGYPVAMLGYGRPTWFPSAVPVVTDNITVEAGDVFVFPETVAAEFGMVDAVLGLPNRKLLFCQNHLGVFSGRALLVEAAPRLSGVYTCAAASARFLEAAFALEHVAVVPPAIDPAVFTAGPKDLSVAYMPRKRSVIAGFIRGAVAAAAPDLADVRWVEIDARSEAETAAALAGAAVFLSLAHEESFGLPAVEAMAAGALVVGLHGGGGREYATTDNGVWFGADDVEACAWALIRLLRALKADRQRGWRASLLAGGRATAQRYSPEHARSRLFEIFAELAE